MILIFIGWEIDTMIVSPYHVARRYIQVVRTQAYFNGISFSAWNFEELVLSVVPRHFHLSLGGAVEFHTA